MIEEFCDIFWPQMAMLAVVYVLVLVMIFLDLWSGVRKATANEREQYEDAIRQRFPENENPVQL